MAKFISISAVLPLVIGCGGASPPAEEPSSSSPDAFTAEIEEQEEAALANEQEAKPAAPEEPEVTLVAAMPTGDCAEKEQCVPPKAFANAVCRGRYPGLAISMFEKDTPWQRRYVDVAQIEPVNTYGGKTTAPLVFTEEVLVLHNQGSGSDTMVISGASDVDVLRWDGTCATVREEFLAEHRTPTIKNANIVWRYLDDETQKGLLEAKYVQLRYGQQRKACRRSSASNPSEICRKATERLNDAITVAVRGGIELPEPGQLPTWKPADSK